MSIAVYIAFHKKLEEVGLSKGVSFEQDNIFILEENFATFINCFYNQFIYELQLQVPMPLYLKWSDTVHADLDAETKSLELERISYEKASIKKLSLYNFLQAKLEVGEFAEIYTDWISHVHFNLGPPETEQTMCLKELLNEAISLELTEKHKIKIIKTE